MKNNSKYYLPLILFCICSILAKAQPPVPEVEKAYKELSQIVVKDSLFLQGIDNYIFDSFCPDIKNKENKIFNVYCKSTEDHYDVLFYMVGMLQFRDNSIPRGYFEYKDYLFIWYGAVPGFFGKVSNQKKKLSYMKGVPPIVSDLATFTFSYTQEEINLTGMSCF
ncbi:MAG: hypothetical protein LIO93_02160 [Bacteroidales bacterium]|nr:hypothetical protein [Bacteroidales bacterium]